MILCWYPPFIPFFYPLGTNGLVVVVVSPFYLPPSTLSIFISFYYPSLFLFLTLVLTCTRHSRKPILLAPTFLQFVLLFLLFLVVFLIVPFSPILPHKKTSPDVLETWGLILWLLSLICLINSYNWLVSYYNLML